MSKLYIKWKLLKLYSRILGTIYYWTPLKYLAKYEDYMFKIASACGCADFDFVVSKAGGINSYIRLKWKSK